MGEVVWPDKTVRATEAGRRAKRKDIEEGQKRICESLKSREKLKTILVTVLSTSI